MNTVISKDGTKIAYDRTGIGPALILVGGALQHRSDQLMGRLAPLLAKDFTVISYDRRGRGDSTDGRSYATDREIEDLESVITEAGGSAYVFGMSSGGILALLAATKLPYITKIAVYEAPFISDQEIGTGAAEYTAQLKEAVAGDERSKAVKLFMKRIGMPAPILFIMRLMPMWSQLKKLAPTLVYDALIVGDGSVPQQFASITAPTLLVTGMSDPMKEGARAAAGILPNAQHKVLEGQTHNVKPDVLAPVLRTFFKGN
ncbi:MAG: alpha/beta hydrolase [Candidatus Kaiserbacteria bacterium]|nr:alpha/beta hydrolase [Candidatus Kaiserbacteria bacterium]